MSVKVLHLIDSGGLYGAEVVLLHLVEEQLKAGLRSLVLSAGAPDVAEKPLEKAMHERGLPFKMWRMRVGLNIVEAWKIIRFAQREGFQILHSHGYKFNILMGVFPRILRQIPLLTTLHGYVNARRYSKMWIYEHVDKLMLRRIEAIVLVNSVMRHIGAVQNLDSTRIYEISNGIPINTNEYHNLPEDPQIENFLSKHSHVIGSAGRLSREKGFRYLIEAFNQLRPSYPELGLLLIGEGGEFNQLQEQIQQCGIADHVLMPGYRSSIPTYLSKIDVFVMPSLTEGLPMTLLEAMLVGTPVIASSVGGIPQILDNGRYGKLVGPEKVDQLSIAIKEVLDNIMRAREIAREAQQWIKARYSISSMEQSYRQLYLNLISV